MSCDDADIDEDFDVFDNDDMEDDDFTWNRFQMGWQIGVNVNFQKAYLGLSYGGDFTKTVKYMDGLTGSGKDYKMKTTSITLGFKF